MIRRALLPLCALLAVPAFAQTSQTSLTDGKPQPKATHAARPSGKKPTAADAKAFTNDLETNLRKLWVRSQTAEWIKSTYITDDTERNAAALNDDTLAYISEAVKKAATFNGVKVDPKTERMLYLLKVSTTLPAPENAEKRAELTQLAAKLEGIYGKGKACMKNGKCLDLTELEELFQTSRNSDELLDAWVSWHQISKEMRPLYTREVALANEGAKELGFANLGDLWRSGYDMPPAEFEKEENRLWEQVKPLYDDLHCYVRGKLAKAYPGKVADKGPIPAHLLGNMWAQEWTNVYPLVEPFPGQTSLDVTAAMKQQNYDPVKMVKLGESFFTSLGLAPLPKTFWERSQFVKPKDREVVCHASSWDVQYNNDLRLKMCLKVNEEDLVTVHHELGHSYYFMAYYKLPILFQQGANDGFHEAIGDALTLSITPEYLHQLGLVGTVVKNDKNLINKQMKDALEKVAFLPFGFMIDKWRWDVFSGKTPPSRYNQAWWELREKYQGVKPPVARSEQDFDPGAKYHVASSTPYARYFLARILQFQFYKAMCQAAGFKGPLYECSFYGNKEAGKRLQAMLELGASKPWPDALEAIAGTRKMDAGPLLEYFQPLQQWLKQQNQGQACGW